MELSQQLTLFFANCLLQATGTKRCTKCGQTKVWDEFFDDKRMSLGKSSWCKQCAARNASDWEGKHPVYRRDRRRKLSPERRRSDHLKQTYGLSIKDFDSMFANQNGRCGVCGKFMGRPFVDHCHTSGKIRGLLCQCCNLALGYLHDRSDVAIKAANYLEKHRA
jgi:hypothetical protein